MTKGGKGIQSGRPRLEVDIDTILLLRQKEHMGWRRIAAKYRELSGEYISHMTIKRRYLEAQAQRPQGIRGILRKRFGLR